MDFDMFGPIPLDEAASFFGRLRGFDKTASIEDAYGALASLPEEQQQEALKEAAHAGVTPEQFNAFMKAAADKAKIADMGPMGAMAGGGQMGAMSLPGTAMGKNTVSMPSPPSLPATGMGQNKVGAATSKSPLERGHDNTAAEFEKRHHHKGERTGGHLGGAAGAAGGAALAHRYLKGNPAATVGGAALGYAAGKSLGKDVGHSVDEKRFKKHASLMKQALEEMGLAAGHDEGGTQALQNYLTQEETGLAQENEGAAAYYQQRFQEASQQLQQVQQQMEQSQQQTDQLQQQVSGSNEQIQAAMQQAQMAQQSAMGNVQQASQMAMDATNQALQSQSDALQQKQLAAAMRMGVQQVKDQVMNALAQDPTDQLAQQLQSPPPGSAGMAGGAPMSAQAMGQQDPSTAMAGASQQAGQGGTPPAGPAGQAPAPEGQPGAAPPDSSEPQAKNTSKGEGSESTTSGTTKVEVKQAFATTTRGHEHDAKAYELLGRQMAERAEMMQAESALDAHGAPGGILDTLRFNLMSPLGMSASDMHQRPDQAARHYEYAAKEHAKGNNAWNPWGGTFTPSKHEKGGNALEYGASKVKKAFSLPGAAIGAVAGGAAGAGYSQMDNGPLRDKVTALEGSDQSGVRGFGRALQLASARMRLAMGSLAEDHPVGTSALAAMQGGAIGGSAGPEMLENAKGIGSDLATIFRNTKARMAG